MPSRALALLLAVGLVACSGPGSDDDDEGGGGEVKEPELRRELLEMRDADQAEMTGEVSTNGYEDRVQRLREIIGEHGWPTWELVGRDGASAAWLIAQHADLDVGLQEQALELMHEAVADDNADASELAYLEDRVAVAHGDPQTYGTQMRCDENGEPVPATPITDQADVDRRRADVGLQPLADYMDEMRQVCAEP